MCSPRRLSALYRTQYSGRAFRFAAVACLGFGSEGQARFTAGIPSGATHWYGLYQKLGQNLLNVAVE